MPAKAAATFPECRMLTYGDAAAMRQTVTHIAVIWDDARHG